MASSPAALMYRVCAGRARISWIHCQSSPRAASIVLLQCLFDRFGSVFPQCGLMVFPGVVIVS
ncbi:hypothetical protein, partial [Bifidobacterium longum]|uniref:hypothetical protein n=1 Tax=Bifidobacterium longum TaxID=216816 RepID=UPI001E5F0A36